MIKVKLSEFYFGLIFKMYLVFVNTNERYDINSSVMADRFLTDLLTEYYSLE